MIFPTWFLLRFIGDRELHIFKYLIITYHISFLSAQYHPDTRCQNLHAVISRSIPFDYLESTDIANRI